MRLGLHARAIQVLGLFEFVAQEIDSGRANNLVEIFEFENTRMQLYYASENSEAFTLYNSGEVSVIINLNFFSFLNLTGSRLRSNSMQRHIVSHRSICFEQKFGNTEHWPLH